MKKISSLALAAVIAFMFSSCSSKDSISLDNKSTSLLKTYKIKRDATGAYSIDFDVLENTKIDKLINHSDNSSEFVFSPSNNISSKQNLSEDLLINNNKLQISFVDGLSNDNSNIIINDDNIRTQRKSGKSKLKSYSVESIDDVTYNLSFEVKNNVEVSFVYNNSISTYEVHLKDGDSSKKSEFVKTLEKIEDEPLKIVFVNYYRLNKGNAKSSDAEYLITRKPEVIIN